MSSDERADLTEMDIFRERGVPPQTQRRLRREGKFPPTYRIGRRVFIRRSTWDAWVEEQERQSAGSTGG